MCPRVWPETEGTSFHWVCSQTGAANHSWASGRPTERQVSTVYKYILVFTVGLKKAKNLLSAYHTGQTLHENFFLKESL